jgi:hypothetical protein
MWSFWLTSVPCAVLDMEWTMSSLTKMCCKILSKTINVLSIIPHHVAFIRNDKTIFYLSAFVSKICGIFSTARATDIPENWSRWPLSCRKIILLRSLLKSEKYCHCNDKNLAHDNEKSRKWLFLAWLIRSNRSGLWLLTIDWCDGKELMTSNRLFR